MVFTCSCHCICTAFWFMLGFFVACMFLWEDLKNNMAKHMSALNFPFVNLSENYDKMQTFITILSTISEY